MDEPFSIEDRILTKVTLSLIRTRLSLACLANPVFQKLQGSLNLLLLVLVVLIRQVSCYARIEGAVLIIH